MPKKKSKFKIVLIVIAVLFVLGIIGNLLGGDTEETSNTNPTISTTSENPAIPTEKAEVGEQEAEEPTPTPTLAPPTPTEGPKMTIYDAGTYKVGSDIPSGEYVVFCDDFLMGYMEVSSDSSGELDSIIANDNFDYNTIITLNEGEYFKMQGSYAVPFEEVEYLDTTGSGMFKVGVHLTAGEYKLECTDDTIGLGYYEVDSDSSHDLESIVANENFEGNTYITVSEGQYLKITSAKIVE
jgi:hypothetical protein